MSTAAVGRPEPENDGLATAAPVPPPEDVPKGLSGPYAQALLEGLERMPALAPVAARLLQLTMSDRASAKDVVQVIENDQALSGRLLRLVNSAAAGLGDSVTSVSKATVLLGFTAVRSCALSVLASDAFRGHSGDGPFDQAEFWKHSIAVACASWLLAQHVRNQDDEEAFTGGLLHDVGRLALATILPEVYETIDAGARQPLANSLEVERRQVGTTHARLGGLVADKWALPPVLKNAMVLHHTPTRYWPERLPGRNLAQLVQLADRICRQQHIGLGGRYLAEPSVEVLSRDCGFPLEAVQEVYTRLPEQIERRAQALEMGQFDADSVYKEALHQANDQLGRFMDSLVMANLKLTRQQQRIDGDLRLAARVQQTIVPSSVTTGRVRVEVGYEPMIRIGGDYAHLRVEEAGPSAICVGDVTGHGIAAALVASRIHSDVSGLVQARRAPVEVMGRVNDLFCNTFSESEALMSLVAAELDPDAGTLTYASAAHPPILHHRRADGHVARFGPQTTFLGVARELVTDDMQATVEVAPGDLLCFYTDGLIEAANADGMQLGLRGLTYLVHANAARPLEEIPASIFQAIAAFRDGPTQDDMLLVVVTYDG